MIIPLEDAMTQQSLYKRCNQREAEHAVRSCPEHDVGLGHHCLAFHATLVALSQTAVETLLEPRKSRIKKPEACGEEG
tara:strand:+ start:179 stop:412 length:234 start_codon:yes stop_codon:yes gene_type:complete